MTAFNQFSVTFTCNGQEFNTTIKSAKCNGTKPALITIEREMIWNLNKNGGKMRKSFGIPANFQIEITGFYMIVAAFETWDGGRETSELYLASVDGQEGVDSFIEGNKDSFASLHTFDSEEHARLQFNCCTAKCDCDYYEDGLANHWTNCATHLAAQEMAEFHGEIYMPGCD